jgi:hypothetical protein
MKFHVPPPPQNVLYFRAIVIVREICSLKLEA